MTSTTDLGTTWVVDDLVGFRGRAWVGGWIWHPHQRLVAVDAVLDDQPRASAQLGLARPDPHHVASDAPSGSGFAVELALPPDRHADELALRVTLADGRADALTDLHGPATDVDSHHAVERRFWDTVNGWPPGRILELGARDRSGTVRRDRAGGHEYLGTDILAGPNVDIVCDVHDIDDHVPASSVDACFAVATFEHLLMPWKAVVAINRVLQPGGLLWISTHQTFPLHEMPWDYWRYSNDGWRGLLNPHTGFAIRDVGMGEPAMIVPGRTHRPLRGMDGGLAYLGASVLAEKVGGTELTWEVDATEVAAGAYPH